MFRVIRILVFVLIIYCAFRVGQNVGFHDTLHGLMQLLKACQSPACLEQIRNCHLETKDDLEMAKN